MPLWWDLAVAAAASTARMLSAYVLSVISALLLGSLMARNRAVERVLLPILDILQSIPILGFFPAALLFFVTHLPSGLGLELASVFLIWTSLVWNMIFGVYSSVKSLDPQFESMAKVYGFGHAARFFYIYTPASRSSLVANSLVSWAGGWFFLTSAEVVSLGSEEYRLNGIGSFVLERFNAGDLPSFYAGVAVLLAIIMLTYVLFWNPAASIVLGRQLPGVLATYEAVHSVVVTVWRKLGEAAVTLERKTARLRGFSTLLKWAFAVFAVSAVVSYALSSSVAFNATDVMRRVFETMLVLPVSLARVALVVVFSFTLSLFTAYVSYKFEHMAQAVALAGETLASVPAIVWWPLLAGVALKYPFGPLLVSSVVFLQGSFWYLYFNTLVYGLANIRRDFEELSKVYRFSDTAFFRYVFVPSLLPSVAAGALSAWGGAWNASVVAEYVEIGDKVIDLGGAGALLNRLAARGDATGLVASALALSLAIVAVNKTVWSRFFGYIESRFGGE